MEITNKTRKPLSVPLPGGKKLFLGPGKSGQVTPKALEFPALKALIDSGDLEVFGGDRSAKGSSVKSSIKPPGGRSGSGGIRHTGDR
jgi:hypothetical protein